MRYFKIKGDKQMETLTSGSIDLKSLKIAGGTASKYITSIDSNTGIQIQAENNTRNIRINSQSVDIRQGTDVLATFGSPTRIGKATAENVTIDSNGLSVNTPDLQSAVVLTSEYDNDVYQGIIALGGTYGNQTPPYILGGTDNNAEWNNLEIRTKTNGANYVGQVGIYAEDELGNTAEVTTQVSNRSATASMGALNENKSSSLNVVPGDIILESESISFVGEAYLTSGSSARSFLIATKPTSTAEVAFGVGGNDNRQGVYSISQNKWVIMCDDSTGDIYIGGVDNKENRIRAWLSDYGTGNDWTYRKYSDGTFDAWGTFTVTPSSSTASGNIYYSNAISVSFPFSMSNAIVTGSVGSQYAWLVNTSSATTTVSFRIARGAAISTSTALSVRLHVFGDY
jgi:hypothetical protein